MNDNIKLQARHVLTAVTIPYDSIYIYSTISVLTGHNKILQFLLTL